MEDGKATAVCFQPLAEVVPALNLVHRLVKNDLLEQVSGRAPVHAHDLQEAGIEPGRKQVAEVPIDRVELALVTPHLEQPFAHAQDCRGASRRPVQPPEQLLTRRLGDGTQPRQGGCRRLLSVGLGSCEHPLWIGRELREQHREESRLFLLVELGVQIERGLRERYTRRLAALGQ